MINLHVRQTVLKLMPYQAFQISEVVGLALRDGLLPVHDIPLMELFRDHLSCFMPDQPPQSYFGWRFICLGFIQELEQLRLALQHMDAEHDLSPSGVVGILGTTTDFESLFIKRLIGHMLRLADMDVKGFHSAQSWKTLAAAHLDQAFALGQLDVCGASLHRTLQ